MSITEDLADALARDALEAEAKLNDDRLIEQLSNVIGAASQTTQEAFMTAVRVRRSEAMGRKFLQDKLAKGPQGD